MGNANDLVSAPELAAEAGVSEEFLQHLVELRALAPTDTQGFSEKDARRVRLLRAWEQAGVPLDAVVRMLDEGRISLAFLDSPSLAAPEPLERSYEELARDADLPVPFVLQLHEALGFAPPRPQDRAREDDAHILSIAKMFVDVSVDETALLGLIRTYADSIRRMTKAEAELYEAEIEGSFRSKGLQERQLLELGSQFGERILPALEVAIIEIYRRHREHVWIEHAVNHAEVELDRMGIRDRAPQAQAICFVDLSGYTRMTEERGDELAARVARNLSSLVYDISLRNGGRPIRWLGDGGMFQFRDPGAAVVSGLEMAEQAPSAGLPPTHIGIHTGPVIFQDGDVYGRTVNLASRIASHATAGEVLVSEETVQGFGGDQIEFIALSPVELKGIGTPMRLYRAIRAKASLADP